MFCHATGRTGMSWKGSGIVRRILTAICLLIPLAAFQGDNYRGVGWLRSTVISGIGNGLSYFVGYIATQKPWEMH